jgi:hypothetical protein
LYVAPSTKTFTASGGCPPAAKVLSLLLTALAVMPGASFARSRKLRSKVGRFSICSRDTFVPTSDVRAVSVEAVAVTATPASCVAASRMETSSVIVWPMPTVTVRVCGVKPRRLTVIS